MRKTSSTSRKSGDHIVYSVTVTLKPHIERKWLDWMMGKHIPAVLRTGYFTGYHLRKLVEPDGAEKGRTYNTEYYCKSITALKTYLNEFAPALRRDYKEKFGSQTKVAREVWKIVAKKGR